MLRKKDYPYQNLSLKNIKGEKWKDIPGLDGCFMVSNYGRVKRMKFQMQFDDGRIVTRKEMIIKPGIQIAWNKVSGDYSYYLRTRVTLQKTFYTFGVARLVYDRFVKPITQDGYEFVVLTKDCDNFNIRPSNLVGTSLHVRSKRMFQNGRAISQLHNLSERKKRKRKHAIIKANSIQVSQYTLDGKKIKTFPSMADAARAVGVNATSIGNAAAGALVTVKNSIWRWGNKKDLNANAESLRNARRKEHRKNYMIKSVTQYDLDGNRIAFYPSYTDAEEATGIKAEHISLVARGINKSAKGYFWLKGKGRAKINLSGYKFKARSESVA